MPQLEELAVNFVSFVPRAAVRDPQQPSEPRRFLVWKGEGVSVPDHEGSHMATQDALADAQRLQKEAEDYRSLPIDAARFGPILKSAFEKLSKDEYAELERVLAAADEQVTKGDLFKQYGDSGPGGTVSGAFEQLEREATALKKSDPSLSAEQALEKAMEANPDLERQYAAEQG